MSPMLMMLSRAIRRVPLDWEHPRDARGELKPLLAGDYAATLADYEAERAQWERGEFPDYASPKDRTLTFAEWDGDAPVEDAYMPTFAGATTLGICMYEEVTEGTPISPIYEDTAAGRLAMATYLAEHPRGIEVGMTEADWLAIIGGGFVARHVHTGRVEVYGGSAGA